MAAAGFKIGDPGMKLAREPKSIMGRLRSKHFIRLMIFPNSIVPPPKLILSGGRSCKRLAVVAMVFGKGGFPQCPAN